MFDAIPCIIFGLLVYKLLLWWTLHSELCNLFVINCIEVLVMTSIVGEFCRIRLHSCPPGGQYWLRSRRLLYCVLPSTGYQEALYRTGREPVYYLIIAFSVALLSQLGGNKFTLRKCACHVERVCLSACGSRLSL